MFSFDYSLFLQKVAAEQVAAEQVAAEQVATSCGLLTDDTDYLK
jgi:hypothetical protein